MTKYLRQAANLKTMQLNEDGSIKLDTYGEPMYTDGMQIRCRRERKLRDVLSQTGSTIRSETTYYFDDTVTINVGDLVDGKPIIDFEEYIDGKGNLVGYEVVV